MTTETYPLIYPDGLPAQLDDRGSDSWCLSHGRVPWAFDGICGACEAGGEGENDPRYCSVEFDIIAQEANPAYPGF